LDGHEARITLLVPVDGNRKSIQGELVALEDGHHARREEVGPVTFPFADEYAKLVLTDKLLAAKQIDSATPTNRRHRGRNEAQED
jgi:ribosome maturation factor RimP